MHGSTVLNSLLSNSGSLNTDEGVTLGTLGPRGVRKMQTLGEDIYQTAYDRGMALQPPTSSWLLWPNWHHNRAYYGSDAVTAKGVLIEHRFLRIGSGVLLNTLTNNSVFI